MKLIVTGSQTRAENAREVLNRAGINAKRQKITETGEGCLHAVAVADYDAGRAVKILEANGIRIKSVMTKCG